MCQTNLNHLFATQFISPTLMAYLQKFLATYYPECARMGNDFEEENPKSVTPLKYNRQRSSRPPSAFELTGLRPSRNRSNSSAIIAMPPDNEAPERETTNDANPDAVAANGDVDAVAVAANGDVDAVAAAAAANNADAVLDVEIHANQNEAS